MDRVATSRWLAEANHSLDLYTHRKYDLAVAFGKSDRQFTATISSLCKAGMPERVARGVYIFPYLFQA